MVFDVSALTLCIYALQVIAVNITLHLRLKMEPDKEHIRHCLLFCFQRKNVLLMHTELFVRRMVKML